MSARWGIIPAAGRGTRIQPLAFSKELLPVGTRLEGASERPRAISEYLIDRMLGAGVDRICFVISSAKTDIVSYFGGSMGGAAICYAVQQSPDGLCDSLFCALPFIAPDDHLYIGLPDTIWFPENGFQFLPDRQFSFLLFPVAQPELFDAVITGVGGRVTEIRVKSENAGTNWVWGAVKMTGRNLADLYQLWTQPNRKDEYLGTLVNAYLETGGSVWGVKRGETYVDVGTLHGYREASRILSRQVLHEAA